MIFRPSFPEYHTFSQITTTHAVLHWRSWLALGTYNLKKCQGRAFDPPVEQTFWIQTAVHKTTSTVVFNKSSKSFPSNATAERRPRWHFWWGIYVVAYCVVYARLSNMGSSFLTWSKHFALYKMHRTQTFKSFPKQFHNLQLKFSLLPGAWFL